MDMGEEIEEIEDVDEEGELVSAGEIKDKV